MFSARPAWPELNGAELSDFVCLMADVSVLLGVRRQVRSGLTVQLLIHLPRWRDMAFVGERHRLEGDISGGIHSLQNSPFLYNWSSQGTAESAVDKPSPSEADARRAKVLTSYICSADQTVNLQSSGSWTLGAGSRSRRTAMRFSLRSLSALEIVLRM